MKAKAIILKIMPTTFEKKAFAALLILAVFFITSYIFLINQTVWNVASRQNSVNEMKEVSSKVAAIEAEYLSKSAKISIEKAYELGFKDVSSSDTIFAVRTAPSVAIR